MTVLPTWFLAHLFRPGGERHQKRPATISPYGSSMWNEPDYSEYFPDGDHICAVCRAPVPTYFVHGKQSVAGIERQGKFYHRGQCFASAMADDMDVKREAASYKPMPANFEAKVTEHGELIEIPEYRMRRIRKRMQDKIPQGNLEESEYRFWIGIPEANLMSQYSMCRACRQTAYSTKERLAHKDDASKAVGGDPCTTQLTHCYRNLSFHMDMCLVCKKPRHKATKWGVPLCKEASCLRSWKFSHDRWIPLEIELKELRARAEALKSAAPAMMQEQTWD